MQSRILSATDHAYYSGNYHGMLLGYKLFLIRNKLLEFIIKAISCPVDYTIGFSKGFFLNIFDAPLENKDKKYEV
jgi:hypothetical protein